MGKVLQAMIAIVGHDEVSFVVDCQPDGQMQPTSARALAANASHDVWRGSFGMRLSGFIFNLPITPAMQY